MATDLMLSVLREELARIEKLIASLDDASPQGEKHMPTRAAAHALRQELAVLQMAERIQDPHAESVVAYRMLTNVLDLCELVTLAQQELAKYDYAHTAELAAKNTTVVALTNIYTKLMIALNSDSAPA